jgi:hypothetical protein
MAQTDLPQGWTWDGVLDRLEEYADLEKGARDHGAIKRVRKIKTAAQLLRLVLAYAVSGFSLRTTVAWAQDAGQVSFSDVALLNRLRGCGPWLADLVGTLTAAANPEGACGDDDRRIVAVDATTVCSPGGLHKPYRKLHTVYDVGAQRFRTTVVSDRRQAERLDIGIVGKGEIRLGDRVYGRYRDLAAVTAAGADYVVRLSARALKLRKPNGKPFNRVAMAKRAQRKGMQEVVVRIEGAKGDKLLTARVIMIALSPEKAEAARRRMVKNARRWDGYTASDDALVTAGCVMLVTSLDAEHWPAQRVLDLYRRRWQAELAFKRLKSLLDLEQLRAFDPDLVNAWIHAVLIVALLIDLERTSDESEAPDSPRSAQYPVQSPYGAISPSSLAA